MANDNNFYDMALKMLESGDVDSAQSYINQGHCQIISMLTPNIQSYIQNALDPIKNIAKKYSENEPDYSNTFVIQNPPKKKYEVDETILDDVYNYIYGKKVNVLGDPIKQNIFILYGFPGSGKNVIVETFASVMDWRICYISSATIL